MTKVRQIILSDFGHLGKDTVWQANYLFEIMGLS